MDPKWYEIRVEGHLGISWVSWFEGWTIQHEEGGQTLLTGRADQAGLHGALAKIRDLGLSLIAVNRAHSTAKKEQ